MGRTAAQGLVGLLNGSNSPLCVGAACIKFRRRAIPRRLSCPSTDRAKAFPHIWTLVSPTAHPSREIVDRIQRSRTSRRILHPASLPPWTLIATLNSDSVQPTNPHFPSFPDLVSLPIIRPGVQSLPPFMSSNRSGSFKSRTEFRVSPSFSDARHSSQVRDANPWAITFISKSSWLSRRPLRVSRDAGSPYFHTPFTFCTDAVSILSPSMPHVVCYSSPSKCDPDPFFSQLLCLSQRRGPAIFFQSPGWLLAHHPSFFSPLRKPFCRSGSICVHFNGRISRTPSSNRPPPLRAFTHYGLLNDLPDSKILARSDGSGSIMDSGHLTGLSDSGRATSKTRDMPIPSLACSLFCWWAVVNWRIW
jgi:hypothetical protein